MIFNPKQSPRNSALAARQWHGLTLAMTLLVCMWGFPAWAQPELQPTSTSAQIDAWLKTLPTTEFWRGEVAKFKAANQQTTPGLIVMAGDSITAGFPVERYYPKGNVVKRGISGDPIAGLCLRLDESIFELKPSKVFILIGINDILSYTLQDYVNMYNYLYARVKAGAPQARVYVQSIMPPNHKILPYAQLLSDANAAQRRLAEYYGFTYIDLAPALADMHGNFDPDLSPDGVHPNQHGCDRWKMLLERYIAE